MAVGFDDKTTEEKRVIKGDGGGEDRDNDFLYQTTVQWGGSRGSRKGRQTKGKEGREEGREGKKEKEGEGPHTSGERQTHRL